MVLLPEPLQVKNEQPAYQRQASPEPGGRPRRAGTGGGGNGRRRPEFFHGPAGFGLRPLFRGDAQMLEAGAAKFGLYGIMGPAIRAAYAVGGAGVFHDNGDYSKLSGIYKRV